MFSSIFAQNLPQVPQNLAIKIPETGTTVLLVLLGTVVLLFGRSLYWAFVGIAGFLLGWALAQEFLADKEQWLQIVAALGAGVLGAILAIFIQRLAFAIGGFFAGAYLATILVARLHPGGDPHLQIWWIVGGIIGAIVAAMLMDWAIIVLSSLAGAAAILSPFQTNRNEQLLMLLFLVLAVIGIVFQGRRLTGRVVAPPAAPPPPA